MWRVLIATGRKWNRTALQKMEISVGNDYKKNIAKWWPLLMGFQMSTQVLPVEGTDGAVFNQVSTGHCK